MKSQGTILRYTQAAELGHDNNKEFYEKCDEIPVVVHRRVNLDPEIALSILKFAALSCFLW
jgi:hypothetical protein